MLSFLLVTHNIVVNLIHKVAAFLYTPSGFYVKIHD